MRSRTGRHSITHTTKTPYKQTNTPTQSQPTSYIKFIRVKEAADRLHLTDGP